MQIQLLHIFSTCCDNTLGDMRLPACCVRTQYEKGEGSSTLFCQGCIYDRGSGFTTKGKLELHREENYLYDVETNMEKICAFRCLKVGNVNRGAVSWVELYANCLT